MKRKRKRYRANSPGVVLDMRGKPLVEPTGTWAMVTTLERCSHCGQLVESTRACEARAIQCPTCMKIFAVKRPRVLKEVK